MHYLHTMIRVGDVDAALDFFCNKLGLVEMSRIDNEKGRFSLIFLAAPDDVPMAKDKKAPMVELTTIGMSTNTAAAVISATSPIV
jgi:lactoylglutathione lyase